MAVKHLKFLLIFFMMTLISGVIFVYLSERSNQSLQIKKNYLSLKKKKDLTIRGFHFSGYHQGRKAITIKAVRFSVEKKKFGVFKFSPLRTARFRGAEVNLYVNNDGFTENQQDKKDMIIKGLFSQETMPVSALKGVTSILFEPVKINFYLDDTSTTQIRANKATIDPRQRRVILWGKILATSALNQLSTERLMIYPEKGLIEVNNKFVLKTQSGKITGEKLATDLFLKQRDRQ